MMGTVALASVDTPSNEADERLARLFDAHHQRLYRLARRLSPTPEDARDLVQDTYVRAAQKLRSVPNEASRSEAWLVRVLVNLCRDRWRKTAVQRRLDRQQRGRPQVSPSTEAATVARMTIWRALEGLAPRRRTILIMCELEELSVAEVARTLGVATVTVRWHLSRGRRELATIVQER